MPTALTQREVTTVCVSPVSDPAVTRTGSSLMMEPSAKVSLTT